MPDHIWVHPVALSTAPIFDDAVYLSEALGLPVNQSEDDLDAELALLARESGIQDPYRFISTTGALGLYIHRKRNQQASRLRLPERRGTISFQANILRRKGHLQSPCEPCLLSTHTSRQWNVLGLALGQDSRLPCQSRLLFSQARRHSRRNDERSGARPFSLYSGEIRGWCHDYAMTASLLTVLIVPALRTHTKDTTPSRAAQSSNAAIRYPHTTFVNTYKKRCVLGHIQFRVAVGEHYHTRC
jgi:hypothetical protein